MKNLTKTLSIMKLIISILLLVNIATAKPVDTKIPNDFPKNWTSYIKNIEVSVDMLGVYKGIEDIEGGSFWMFVKKLDEKTCYYPIRKDSDRHYLADVYCD